MKLRTKNIGILTGANPALLAEQHRLQTMLMASYDENAFSISPDRRTMMDALILPDSGGINATTRAFYPHQRIPPPIPPQDQWFEHFRLYSLNWYIKKRIPIIAIGMSGAMLWSEIFDGRDKGKLHFVEGQIEPMDCQNAHFYSDPPVWHFEHVVYVGFADTPPDETIWEIIDRLSARRDKEDLAAVQIPTTPPQPSSEEGNVEIPPPPR